MNIVYSWLKDIVPIDVPADELADALTAIGLEVAGIHHYSIARGVKVAEVKEVNKHPDADRLSLCRVDTGTGEPLDVVCGAPNVRAGMKAPLAIIGTKLSAEFTVKKAKIRGAASSGMLCSEKELGISDEQSGIMDLPQEYTTGSELSDYYPDDVVIEIEITPDRGDCLSMLGVAREVSARFNMPLKSPVRRPQGDIPEKIDSAISVIIEAPEGCPRYMGRLVRNVQIRPSPVWMQRRLLLAGIRPINNIVDITNYVLLQYGQPMHAFDYAQLAGQTIVVRRAGKNIAFKTLDNIERKLVSGDLLICDGKQPVALAGIMGGAGSEISETTRDVFLECAYFEPVGIRKTSKRLGLSTDSSYRFERGVDPEQGLVDALDTAAELLHELADGTVVSGKIDNYPSPLAPKDIILRQSRIQRLLGIEVSMEQIVSYLESLRISCRKTDIDTLHCTAPLYRHDLSIEADLVEEVGRLYGYDNIPTAERAQVYMQQSLPSTEAMNDLLRNALAFMGFHEAITNSLSSERKRNVLTPKTQSVNLLNPLTPEMAQLQTTLAGGLLDIVAYNLNRKNVNNRFFEIGKTFESSDSGKIRERNALAIVIEGNFISDTWNTKATPCDFYVLKGGLEAFARNIGIGTLNFARSDKVPSYLDPLESAALECRSLVSGYAGKIDENVCSVFDITTNVYYAEFDITELLHTSLPHPQYIPLPKYPALERDFSFVMPEDIQSSTLAQEIQKVSLLIEDVYPFDVFHGEKLGEGKKSVTFSVRIRSNERTLTDKDGEVICRDIIKKMQTKFGAELRQ